MTKKEILKRLRVLVSLPRAARPISVYALEQLAALHKRAIYEILENQSMSERTRVRLERALKWVENDQVKFRRPGGAMNERREVVIEEPSPPCLTIKVVKLTDKGPRLTTAAYNPNALQK